jgi:hypothetical protein
LYALSYASQQEKKSVRRTDFPAEAVPTFAGNALKSKQPQARELHVRQLAWHLKNWKVWVAA